MSKPLIVSLCAGALAVLTPTAAHALATSGATEQCTRAGTTAAATVTLTWTQSSDRPTRVEFNFTNPTTGLVVKATVRTARSAPTDANSFVFNAKANNAPTVVSIEGWNSTGTRVFSNTNVPCA